MYNKFYTEIHAINLLPNEVSEEVIDKGVAERSRPSIISLKQTVQKKWESAVAEALEPVSAFDPTIREHKNIPFEELSAARALRHEGGKMGVDFRPHIVDKNLNSHILCDSGSQICAWPPDPGDKPVPGTHLRAVNGTKINCYGYKQISIKIGRKEYQFQAIKSDVKSPILGWDFFRHYKIGFKWNKWGDIVLFDRKANISQVLKFKSVPHLDSLQLSSLRLVTESSESTDTPPQIAAVAENSCSDIFQTFFQVASMQELGEANSAQNVNTIPEGPYRDLIAKYPDLLKPNFKTEKPKNKILHRIHTGTHPPCRAKARNLLPGSPKAVEGYKAWKQLIDLGIVEPVDPGKPTNWSSPLHLAPKPGGGLRPVGDYRQLNLKTELDLYPLPDLRGYMYKVAGSRYFSKLDLHKAFHQILIDPRDRHKTCVATPWGMYNFRRLSMGLQNSAQSFQKHIDDVLRDIPGSFVYLDDILLFHDNEQAHLETLELILKRLDQAGLTIALEKCEFGKSQLDYLGYTISSKGIIPIKKKIQALEDFPPPLKAEAASWFSGGVKLLPVKSAQNGAVFRISSPEIPSSSLGPIV